MHLYHIHGDNTKKENLTQPSIISRQFFLKFQIEDHPSGDDPEISLNFSRHPLPKIYP
jgi:hypothetical protein